MKQLYNLHPKFKLNGASFTTSELKEFASCLINKGKDFEISIGNFLLEWLSTKPILEVKTSGSTGKPKIIALKKEHMINSALATGVFFNLIAGNSALLCLNSDFIAGKMMLVRAMTLGLELDYVEPTSNPLNLISKKYDFAAMVPLQVESSIKKLNQIKTLIVGGAAIPKMLKEKLGGIVLQIFETYGMTETITHIAVRKVGVGSSGIENYFNLLPNISISQDERNCLVINAPMISENPVFTNDLVDIVSNTKFRLLGRFDNIINSGGVKLIPEEIESKLTGIINNRFFITSIPDDKLGQKLVLVMEGTVDEILKKIKSLPTLNKYEIPKEVYFIKKIIETSSGKFDRKKSLQQALGQ